MQPGIWYPYQEDLSSEERVQQLLKWLTSGDRPDFIAAYFSKLDFVGHEFGPESQEVPVVLIFRLMKSWKSWTG